MLAVILLPTAILLSLRLLYYLFVPPRDREPLDEPARRLQYRLQSAGFILLAGGLLASAWVYRQAAPESLDNTGVVSYEIGNGYTIAFHAADSKKYARDLERIGGKLGVFFTEVGTDVTEAFHGRALAYVLFALSLASCVGCLATARAVNYYRDDAAGGQEVPSVPDNPSPTPPSRTVRWTLKLMRRSRTIRTR